MNTANELYRELSVEDFRDECIKLVKLRRCIPRMLFAVDERAESGSFVMYAVFSALGDDRFEIPFCKLPADEPTFRSLSLEIPAFHWYEREMRDMFGIVPEGHPDPRPLVLHGCYPQDAWPLRRDIPVSAIRQFIEPYRVDEYPYMNVEGEGVYEIPVGPVHAGIIEPGHFRFSAVGETVIFLDPRLFFVHKGTEKHFETFTYEDGVRLAERVSGTATTAHAAAYCQAVERMAGVEISERAAAVRTVFIELERLYNHIGDVGNLCAGTAFALGYARGALLKEALQQLNARITGSRFLRGALAVGGVSLNAYDHADDILKTLERVQKDFTSYMRFLTSDVGNADRLQTTGRLSKNIAQSLGVTGIAARASGINDDVRVAHPHLAYPRVTLEPNTSEAGDVWARMLMRADDAECSFAVIESLLSEPVPGALTAPLPAVEEGRMALGYTEGPRGSVFYVVRSGRDGKPSRVKVRGASFCNWPAVPYAVHGNIVPDFPLVNKSFNLSYSGCDM